MNRRRFLSLLGMAPVAFNPHRVIFDLGRGLWRSELTVEDLLVVRAGFDPIPKFVEHELAREEIARIFQVPLHLISTTEWGLRMQRKCAEQHLLTISTINIDRFLHEAFRHLPSEKTQ